MQLLAVIGRQEKPNTLLSIMSFAGKENKRCMRGDNIPTDIQTKSLDWRRNSLKVRSPVHLERRLASLHLKNRMASLEGKPEGEKTKQEIKMTREALKEANKNSLY